MSNLKNLEQQIERLGGQMVGVQAAIDAILGATLQTGAAKPDMLRMTLNTVIATLPMNPNMREQELAGATAFLTSMLETIESIEAASEKGEG